MASDERSRAAGRAARCLTGAVVVVAAALHLAAPAPAQAQTSNAAPTFSGTLTSRDVVENADVGTLVGHPVTATDPDEGDTLIYELRGRHAKPPASDYFSINSTTGQLSTKAPFDYETPPANAPTNGHYFVKVSVSDGKDENGDVVVDLKTDRDDTIDVIIVVTDLEEAGVVTLSPAQPRIGTVLRATLSDGDGFKRYEDFSTSKSGFVDWQWETSTNGTDWTELLVGENQVAHTGNSYTPLMPIRTSTCGSPRRTRTCGA